MHGQVKIAHRRDRGVRVRHRHGQVAAHADERTRAPVADGTHGVHRIVAMGEREREAVTLPDGIDQRLRRLFRDTHRAVALHVGVTADRCDAGAGLADVPAQQQQVGHLLHVLRATAVLGHAHAVAEDHPLGLRIEACGRGDVVARQARLRHHVVPRRPCQVIAKRVQAFGVFGDEGMVQHAGTAGGQIRCVGLQQPLHHAFEQRQIAADLHLVIGLGDRRGGVGQHLPGMLRRGEALQAAFAQRIHRHDGHAPLRYLA